MFGSRAVDTRSHNILRLRSAPAVRQQKWFLIFTVGWGSDLVEVRIMGAVETGRPRSAESASNPRAVFSIGIGHAASFGSSAYIWLSARPLVGEIPRLGGSNLLYALRRLVEL